MSTRKRKALVGIGLVAAASAALLTYVLKSYATDSKAPAPSAQKNNWGRIAIVVSGLDNYQNLLDSNPSLMLVGTKLTKLRGTVKKQDEFRVIETETDNGWEHIVKHLRPDTVILSQGLNGDNIRLFTQRVLQMEDAYHSL